MTRTLFRAAVLPLLLVLLVLVACSSEPSPGTEFGRVGSAIESGFTAPAVGETQSPPPVPAPDGPDLPVAPRSLGESSFLTVLDGEGIPYVSEELALDAGYAVCEFLRGGGSTGDAALIIVRYTPLSAAQAGTLVGASRGALCRGAGA